MPKRIPISESRIKELEEFRKSKWKASEFRRYLCVWLRVESGMSAEEIASAVGLHADTVRVIQRNFIAIGKEAFCGEGKGGRRNQFMTFEEEAEFLKDFIESAGEASLLVVNEIKAAMEEKVGQEVHKTTVYRILKRHDWRKIKPRPKHSKQDKEAVEAFKKGAAQRQ